MALVYCTTNLVNGKKYIGSTRIDSENYLGSGRYIKQALKKYGKENFKRQVLWDGADDLRWEMENYWLAYFNCASNKMFYNISDRAGGNPDVNKGRVLTNAHKEAISKGSKGRVTSHKTRVKKSKVLVKIDGSEWMTTGELANLLGHANRTTITSGIKHLKGAYKNSRKLREGTMVSELLQKGLKFKKIRR